jgi:hypothetical protein
MHGTLAQSGTRQQIDIGVEGESEHPGGTDHIAHLGEHAPLQAQCGTQRRLEWPAELQKIGIRIGHHIGRHGQWQQQGPLKETAPGKIKQRHGHSR